MIPLAKLIPSPLTELVKPPLTLQDVAVFVTPFTLNVGVPELSAAAEIL
jgi:hypothetical protein